MKYLIFVSLFAIMACSHSRKPSSLSNEPATDSVAGGNLTASAVKTMSNQETCFDIDITTKSFEQNVSSASNWTLAWVDANKQYHPVNLKQRDPASTPKGGRVAGQYGEYEQWANTFYTCVPGVASRDVKELVLTPKSLPHTGTKELHLAWE